jgi:hypothetical protein
MRGHTRFRANLSSCHQLSPHQQQVAEREQRKELSPVFGAAALAGLHMAKLAFDHPEGMLDSGPHLGEYAVCAFLKRMQLATLWGLTHDARELAGTTERRCALSTDVSIAKLSSRHDRAI